MSKITVNNIELYYEEHGDGLDPIIFVHGFLSSSNMWHEHYISHLPDRYHAYVLDMRGHGKSNQIKTGCNVVQLADDVYKFSKQLNVSKFLFVGMSMGGAVGIQLALDHPEVLNALILMNPGFRSTISGGYRFILPLVALMAQKRWLLKRLLKSTLTRTPGEEFIHPFLKDAMLVSRKTWVEYIDPKNKIGKIDRLSRLEVPTLVMLGGKDRVFPRKMQHNLADTIPYAEKVVFEEAGHGMFCEIPEQIFMTMITFLKQLS